MTEEEEVIYEGNIPLKAFLCSHNILYLLLLGWNIGLISSLLKKMNWHVKITDQRLVLVQGILSQHQEEIEYYRITDSEYNQNFKERLFNVGRITIAADDASAPKITFPIHDPKEHREKIRNNVREERKNMRAVNVD